MTRLPPLSREVIRLRAELIANASRIRELEEALARCMNEGIEFRKVMRYYDDAPTPTDYLESDTGDD